MLVYAGVVLLAAVAGVFAMLAVKVAQAKRATRKPNCYYCGSPAMRRSSPNGLADRMLTYWNCVPYRCEICFNRQYRLAGLGEEENR